jgi:hypothetical protein
MKAYILMVGILFFNLVLTAQARVTLIMRTNPTATLANWESQPDLITVLIQAGQGASMKAKVKTTIKTIDGNVIGAVDVLKMPVVTVIDVLKLSTADVLPLSNTIFSGNAALVYRRTGRLPADNYQLCVQLLNADNLQPITEETCKIFYVTVPMLPNLLMPAHEAVLTKEIAQSAITFRWTPLTPRPERPAVYQLQVFEILSTQTPMQALRSNQPLLNTQVLGLTQYIWQPQLAMGNGVDYKNFIWTVQTLDGNSLLPITETSNQEGRSEPFTFSIKQITKPLVVDSSISNIDNIK